MKSNHAKYNEKKLKAPRFFERKTFLNISESLCLVTLTSSKCEVCVYMLEIGSLLIGSEVSILTVITPM